MKIRLAKLAFFLFLLSSIPACGVFEVGLEEFPARETATPPPALNLPHTSTLPSPTQTPFIGPLKPGQAVRITRIQMQSKTSGWGIGQVETDLVDHILYTSDGGRSWQERTPLEALLNPPAQGLTATAFFSADGTAWATYTSQFPQPAIPEKQVIWRTTDYGQTWQAGEELALTGVQAEYFLPEQLGFFDEKYGWLLAHTGAGMSHDYIVAFVTDDGGLTWQRVLDAEKNSELMICPKTGLAFFTATNGLLTGNCPSLMDRLFFYGTADGGQTWQPASLLPPANQPADLFTSDKAGCGIPALTYVSARSIMLTVRCEIYATKRLAAWLYTGQPGGTLAARPLPLPYGTLQFINSEEGWLVGAQQNDPAAPGEIYHTTNGGQNWSPVIATAWQGIPNFIDSNTGWVVARTDDKLALVYTTNGGILWEEIYPVIGK
jgi:photosystem II stability/assembly factor-like uncharacterized protein